MRFIRKTLGTLIALGLIGFGIVAFIGQSNVAERTGNMDDFYAGLVMGGLAVFAGVITFYVTFKAPKARKDPEAAAAAIWGVGMATLADDDGGYDGD